jgi:hypothetical protein
LRFRSTYSILFACLRIPLIAGSAAFRNAPVVAVHVDLPCLSLDFRRAANDFTLSAMAFLLIWKAPRYLRIAFFQTCLTLRAGRQSVSIDFERGMRSFNYAADQLFAKIQFCYGLSSLYCDRMEAVLHKMWFLNSETDTANRKITGIIRYFALWRATSDGSGQFD